MQKEERNLEFTGDLLQEFEEVQKLVNDDTPVPYATWSKVCTSFCTIICC